MDFVDVIFVVAAILFHRVVTMIFLKLLYSDLLFVPHEEEYSYMWINHNDGIIYFILWESIAQ